MTSHFDWDWKLWFEISKYINLAFLYCYCVVIIGFLEICFCASPIFHHSSNQMAPVLKYHFISATFNDFGILWFLSDRTKISEKQFVSKVVTVFQSSSPDKFPTSSKNSNYCVILKKFYHTAKCIFSTIWYGLSSQRKAWWSTRWAWPW